MCHFPWPLNNSVGTLLLLCCIFTTLTTNACLLHYELFFSFLFPPPELYYGRFSLQETFYPTSMFLNLCSDPLKLGTQVLAKPTDSLCDLCYYFNFQNTLFFTVYTCNELTEIHSDFPKPNRCWT